MLDDTWHVETIDPYGGGNPRTSIAVDTHGHPHISYADLGLYYAEFDGSQWHTTRIDNNTIKSTFEQGRETGLKVRKRKEAVVTTAYTLAFLVRTPEEVVNSFFHKERYRLRARRSAPNHKTSICGSR